MVALPALAQVGAGLIGIVGRSSRGVGDHGGQEYPRWQGWPQVQQSIARSQGYSTGQGRVGAATSKCRHGTPAWLPNHRTIEAPTAYLPTTHATSCLRSITELQVFRRR